MKIRTNIRQLFIIICLLFFSCSLNSGVWAQAEMATKADGLRLHPTEKFTPAILDGIQLYPDNPLKLDFIIDTGDDLLKGSALEAEANNLIHYFFAALTIPEQDLWVNLSPYEQNRIMAPGLSKTLMGKDMLAQDYILKQLTASLLYPEDILGSQFWQKVKQTVYSKFGNNVEIPTQTFNKIWITPESADIYIHGNHIFVADSRLKVMLEDDYLALAQHSPGHPQLAQSEMNNQLKEMIKSMIIPEIEREVNSGKHFTKLRQIYHSMILATWYKQHLKTSLLNRVYSNKRKTLGIEEQNNQALKHIYEQYVKTFQQGVFNYTKEELDPQTEEITPRKYVCGGLALTKLPQVTENSTVLSSSSALLSRIDHPKVVVGIRSQFNTTSSSGISEDPIIASEEFKTPNVKAIWEHINREMTTIDPYIADKKEGVLARTYKQLNRTLYSIDQKVRRGEIQFITDLNLLKSAIQNPQNQNQPVRIGVFALNANPIHWSNINSQLMLMDEKNLNTIVFLPMGKLNEVGLPASHIASEDDRHRTSQKFLERMSPLLQYSDFGRGTDLSGEQLLQEFLKRNADRTMTVYYSAGTENEAHIKKVMESMIDGTQSDGFKQTDQQKLVLTFIPIDEHLAGSISDDDLKTYLNEVAAAKNLTPADLSFSTELAVRGYDELGYTIHATLYRRGDRALVPSEFDQLAQEKGYYGYPRPELKDGQWTTISMDEAIAQRLTPLVDQLAQMIIQKFPDGNAVIAIDGQSASGKSVISKLLQTRLKELLPHTEISLFGLDAYLKEHDFRHAIEKWITNEPITEEELKLVPEDIKRSVPRGGIYDAEQDLFDNDSIRAKLTEASQFFKGANEVGGLTIEHPYNHEGKTAIVKPLHIPLKKGGILIAEGKYSNLPILQPYTSLKIRVDDLMEAIRARYELRTRKRDPRDADAQLRFFNQSLAPSYDRYAANTRRQLDLIIDMTSEDPNVWQIIDHHASSAVQNSSQYGGIDLNSSNLKFKIIKNGSDIQFTSPMNISPEIIRGITPMMTQITPISAQQFSKTLQ